MACKVKRDFFLSLRSDLLVREQSIKVGHGENFFGCWLKC